jgi:hypothetical protein
VTAQASGIAEYGAVIVASSTSGSVWLCAHDSGVTVRIRFPLSARDRPSRVIA